MFSPSSSDLSSFYRGGQTVNKILLEKEKRRKNTSDTFLRTARLRGSCVRVSLEKTDRKIFFWLEAFGKTFCHV